MALKRRGAIGCRPPHEDDGDDALREKARPLVERLPREEIVQAASPPLTWATATLVARSDWLSAHQALSAMDVVTMRPAASRLRRVLFIF